MSDIFCKMISGEIKPDIVAEGKEWIAINDIHPQAPTHILIIPKKHIGSITGLTDADAGIAGSLMLAVKTVAEKLELSEDGFRVIMNHGEHGGQTVAHLHIHVLGGKPLGPKMVH